MWLLKITGFPDKVVTILYPTNANSRTTKTYFIILADYMNHTTNPNQTILTDYQLVNTCNINYQQKMPIINLGMFCTMQWIYLSKMCYAFYTTLNSRCIIIFIFYVWKLWIYRVARNLFFFLVVVCFVLVD